MKKRRNKKQTKPTVDPGLERQRKRSARLLLKRRRAKSGQ